MSNRNTFWATLFVDALARAGLQHICIAPGSRSTPLTLAFAKHDAIQKHTHLDERSAAFFALGLALASDNPVALVCTSGTAGANFYPAIIEAHQSRVPLIVITADRPHELRHSGANQTIDQIKLFGDFVLWAVDAALPEAEPPAVALRNLQTLAARAVATANGMRKGVVHLNMPFRKPLEPIPVTGDMTTLQDDPIVTHFAPPIAANPQGIAQVQAAVQAHASGLIICGTRTPALPHIAALSERIQYPILGDALSQIRFGTGGVPFSAYDNLRDLREVAGEPDVILRFGNVPTSKTLNTFLANARPRHLFQISQDGVWSDDAHVSDTFIHSDVKALCDAIEGNHAPEYAQKLSEVEQLTWQTVTHHIENGAYFDGAVVHDVVNDIPPESTLFIGNSLPVRLLDQFGKPQNKPIHVYANRGASGIDGNISTALGAGAAAHDKPLVAIMGDITFYHDMNGLLAVQRLGIPITIVLLNNDGGGIFNRLPIRDFEPAFTDYFVMPHGLQYEHAARLYGLDYVCTDDRETFRDAFRESVQNHNATIIEVRTDAQHDNQRRSQIMDAVHRELNI